VGLETSAILGSMLGEILAADEFLETSIGDLALYAERRRDLLTAIARLGQAGST
jgi:hypothetical protein